MDNDSLTSDARSELAFQSFFQGLADEARRNDEQRPTNELARLNQQYLRSGYRRMYADLTGVPLEQ